MTYKEYILSFLVRLNSAFASSNIASNVCRLRYFDLSNADFAILSFLFLNDGFVLLKVGENINHNDYCVDVDCELISSYLHFDYSHSAKENIVKSTNLLSVRRK